MNPSFRCVQIADRSSAAARGDLNYNIKGTERRKRHFVFFFDEGVGGGVSFSFEDRTWNTFKTSVGGGNQHS